MDDKIEFNLSDLEWWAQPLILGIFMVHQSPEELKRYAELAGTLEPQELKDKKPLG